MVHDERLKDEIEDCYWRMHAAMVEGIGREHSVRKGFVNALDPLSQFEYPVNMAGMFPRVLRDNIRSWINTPKIAQYFRHEYPTAYFFTKWKFSRLDVLNFVENVLSRIGAESYDHEWRQPVAIKQLEAIERSTDVTTEANRILSLSLDEKIEEHLHPEVPPRKLAILDAGTGGGSTIWHIMRRIEELNEDGRVRDDYWNYLRIFLQDTNRDAVDAAANSLMEHIPALRENTPSGGVKKVYGNFVNLHMNQEFMRHVGEIDLIVSFAAACHMTDFPPFFRLMHDMLAPGGRIHIGDWYCGPSWHAPWLRISRDDKRKMVYYIWGTGDENPYELRVYDGQPLDRITTEIFFDRMEKARRVMAVYEMLEEDAILVVKNYKTLLALLGWVRKDKREKVEAKMIDGADVDDYVTDEFWKDVQSGTPGFNFLGFLKDVVCRKRVYNPYSHDRAFDPLPLEGLEKSAYYLIEGGTGRRYSDDMAAVGFGQAYNVPFLALRKALWSKDGGTYVGLDTAYMIEYAIGRK